MKIISTENAPAAIGPYSQAIEAGGFIFCSGQIPMDPQSMEIVGDDIITQTKQVFKNLKGLLEAAGVSLNHVVKTSVFLDSMDDFVAMNNVYAEEFGDHKPARACVEVSKNPKGVLVEIECVVFKG